MFEKIGTAGHVAGYDVLILADAVIVTDPAESRRFPVPNYGTRIGALAARPGFRLGWGRFPDGAEVLSLSDRDDGGFGDAVNPTMPGCSEWGYAPFPGTARLPRRGRPDARPAVPTPGPWPRPGAPHRMGPRDPTRPGGGPDGPGPPRRRARG